MIDTHCHIFKDYYDNIDEIVNIDALIVVSGTNDIDNKEVIELCNKYDNVYGTLGIYPLEEMTKSSLDFIEKHINDPKIVGIGEIGLDYHTDYDKNEQKEKFIKQLDLAEKYNKTVVIHTRDSIQDTYDILKNYKMKKNIHCFSGSLEMAREFIKINSKLGIGGVLTFKNSKLKDVVKNIDISNLLLETDSPYLTPEPFRGTKNKPYNIIYVAREISKIKNINYEEVLKITTNNAISQFDLNKNI